MRYQHDGPLTSKQLYAEEGDYGSRREVSALGKKWTTSQEKWMCRTRGGPTTSKQLCTQEGFNGNRR